MDRLVRVDATDDAACNLRCVGARRYCSTYPNCVAAHVHAVQDWFTPGQSGRRIVREEKRRSALAGHDRTRVVQRPDPGTTVEEIGLHCETLEWETLPRTVPIAVEAAATPARGKTPPP